MKKEVVVNVYFFNLKELDSFLSDEKNKDYIEEITHNNNFINIQKKKEYIASFLLKKRFIKDIYFNEFDKPLSKEIFFNISHSHDLICLATSEDFDIGVDIEKNRPMNEKLSEYISNKEELDEIKKNNNFFEIWTAKEAIVKAIGTGLNKKINTINPLPLNSVIEYENKKISGKTYSFQDYIVSIYLVCNMDFSIKNIVLNVEDLLNE